MIRDKSVCVCICGFAPRSIKYTYESIQKNIIDPLNKHFNVDVFMFSLLSRNNIIDVSEGRQGGMTKYKVNNDDIYLLHTTDTQTEYQEDVDDIINLCEDNKYCEYIDLKKTQTKNFLRDLYQEEKCFRMIDNYKYDVCVMLGPDFYITKQINIDEVFDCMSNDNILYTTSYNDCGGIANKFYIGSINVMNKICTRKSIFNNWLEHEKNYYTKSNKIKITIFTIIFVMIISMISITIYTSTKYLKFITLFTVLLLLSIGSLITTNIIKVKAITNPERFIQYTINTYNITRKKSDMFYLKIRSNGKSNWYINKMNNFVSDFQLKQHIMNTFKELQNY